VENKTAREMLFSDYKEFQIAGHGLAVAQLTCVDSTGVLGRKQELLDQMRRHAKDKGFDLMLLMVTDVLMDGTRILYVGDDDAIQQAFNRTPKDNEVFLPKVMSRKKQIIPMLSDLWG
jgi:manganese-dependent inorganic pyrophosphatase